MNRVGLISSASLAALVLSAMSLATSAQESGQQPLVDMRKAAIERPIKRLLSGDSQRLPAPTPERSAKSTNFNNPKVKPGLVHWHPDFATACAESRRSGKPALVFHMMGKLDDGFC